VREQRALRVNFLLPFPINFPVGGYKVVYRYANGLVDRGHTVRVVLPKSMDPRTGVVGEIKNRLWPKLHVLRNPGGITWFPLDPRVELLYRSDLREKWLPEADFSVATFWRTAPILNAYSARMGKKLYLIQHFETFAGSLEEVGATWKLPLHKIVIAKWLEALAGSMGQSCTYIPNGIDFDEFGIDAPIEARPRRVAMLFHSDAIKGAWDGINALELVKERYPDLSVVLFGVQTRPGLIPPWMEYVSNAPSAQVRAIYNSCSVFLHPSWSEGCPAPPAEAMACGAAVVAAANDGVLDYLKPGVNGVTARPKYWLELADRLTEVLGDEPRRIAIAYAGNRSIQEYTWTRAVDSFEKLLRDEVSAS
jgi:glycosyltransferase involved in cell wall biosynthesis